MKGRAAADPVPGPLRWSYRTYSVVERPAGFGRRFEVRSPKDELVLVCRSKRSEQRLVFHADDAETQELFRLEPTEARTFQRAWDAIDPVSRKPFGQLRKRVYTATEKMEWFVFTTEGEQVGMLTQTAAEPTLLRRIVPMDGLFEKAWELHWRQSIAGKVVPKTALVGDRWEVDLRFDQRDEIDRRLALAVVIAARADAHRPSKTERPPRDADVGA